jgi:hypothetical protein
MLIQKAKKSQRENLTVLAKSNKHNGYCVAAVNKNGKIIRLVRDKEGHALFKNTCNFNRLNRISADIIPAPLKNQHENFILTEIFNVGGKTEINKFRNLLTNPLFIFGNTEHYLTKKEMKKQKSTLLFVEVEDIRIYRNCEDKYKVDFTHRNDAYKGFSITDPKFLNCERKIEKAKLLFSLPDAPYTRYGRELFYKFIAAVYIG